MIGDVVFRDIMTVPKDGQGKNPTWFESLVGSIIEYGKNTIVLNGVAYERKLKEAKSETFNDLIKRWDMLDYAHFDFMNINNMDYKSKCSVVSFEQLSPYGSKDNIASHFIFLSENHILFTARRLLF